MSCLRNLRFETRAHAMPPKTCARVLASGFWALGKFSRGNFRLHCLLSVCQGDAHLLERNLVQRAGGFQSLGLLILLQAIPCSIIKLSRLIASIKAAFFQNRLG